MSVNVVSNYFPVIFAKSEILHVNNFPNSSMVISLTTKFDQVEKTVECSVVVKITGADDSFHRIHQQLNKIVTLVNLQLCFLYINLEQYY